MLFTRLYKLLLLLLLAAARLQAQSPDPKDLVLYLPFNGDANDKSTNQYSAVIHGAAPDTGVDGQPNTAYYFNGTGSSIVIPNVTALDGGLTELTVLMRMMVLDLTPQPDVLPPFSTHYEFLTWHRQQADSTNAFLASRVRAAWVPPDTVNKYNGAFLNYFMTWCSSGNTTASGYAKDTQKVERRWTTFALVYNKGTVKVFHNCGRENLWENTVPAVSDVCGTEPMQITIGDVPRGLFALGYRPFKGKIDELRIYKRALSDDEVKQYADTTCREDIIPVGAPHISAVADVCKPYQYTFTDASSLQNFTTEKKEWQVDQDAVVEADTLFYNFTRTGSHTIRMTLRGSDTTFSTSVSVHIDSLHPLRYLSAAANVVDVCEKSSVVLQASGGTSYNWQPCQYLDDCHSKAPTSTPAKNVLYTLAATDANGCADSLQVSVHLKPDTAKAFVPSAFTPNGDGRNDSFGPLSFSRLTNLRFVVYNGFGQKIFASQTLAAKWNGTYRNLNQPTGTYIWMMQYQSGNGCSLRTCKGTVQLIR